MSSDQVYLKQNVLIEPLVDSWYAWSHLISPATLAMNVVGRHLRIIDSYVMAPEIHAEAVKNPKMAGGPFMDYDVDRSRDIKALKVNTEKECSHIIQLAREIKALSTLLAAKTDGTSLHPLYEKVPPLLRGFVELVYDIRHQPSFRFFESLLYRSEFYDKNLQSISLSLIDDDYRPFALSTPRIVGGNTVRIAIPFEATGIDELVKMKRTKGSFAKISRLLDVPETQLELFRSFFTEQEVESNHRFDGDGVRVRYFGHACILVETQSISILSDPVISYGYDTSISRYTYKDLPDSIDFVVITHNHQDHILLETMLQIRHKVKTILIPKGGNGTLQDPSLKLMFKAIGFDNVIEIDEMECFTFDGGKISGLPFIGEHCDLDIRTKLCYHVSLPNVSMIFAADSCNVEPELYTKIHKEIGDIDILFLGMECDGAPLSWLYGPYITGQMSKEIDQSRRLAGSNYKQGIAFVNTFNPKQVFVYAMGQEPWLNYIMAVKYTEESNPIIASNRLLAECESRGIGGERLFGEKNLTF